MNLYLICGLLLYDSVGILAKFKIGCYKYVRLKNKPQRESNQGDICGILTWDLLDSIAVMC